MNLFVDNYFQILLTPKRLYLMMECELYGHMLRKEWAFSIILFESLLFELFHRALEILLSMVLIFLVKRRRRIIRDFSGLAVFSGLKSSTMILR